MSTSRLRIYAAAFCMDATAYGAGLLLPIQAFNKFGASPLELGLIGTIINATYTVACLLSGRLSDRVGSRALYLPGAAIVFAAALPIIYFSTSLGQLFLATPILGLGLAFYWAPLERELGATSTSRNLWKTAGTFNCVWAAGICLGSLGGPALYDQLNFKAGVLLLLGLSGLALALLAPRLRIEPRTAAAEAPPPAEEPGSSHLLLAAWIANFSAYFAFSGINYQLANLGKKHLGIGVAMLGLLAFTINLARFGSFFTLRRLSGWHYSLRWLFIVQFVTALALLGLSNLARPAFYFALLPLVGVFSALSYSLSFYYGLRVPSKRGRNSGLHEAALSLGLTLGPLACGAAASALPGWPAAALAAAGAMILLALFAELIIIKKYRGAESPGG